MTLTEARLLRVEKAIRSLCIQTLGKDMVFFDEPPDIPLDREEAAGYPIAELLTPRAKTVLHLAKEEMKKRGHSYVGSEHILAGLIRMGQGHAPRILEEQGITLEYLAKVCTWQTPPVADERAEYERLKRKYEQS